MTGHRLEIVPLARHQWAVRYEGDPVPLVETSTLAGALDEARNHARQYGEHVVVVHELDGETHVEEVVPDYRAPTPADVKGPAVEP